MGITIPPGVQTILRQFHVEDNVLRKISEDMQAEFIVGLEKGSPASSIAMLPSFVPELPNGSGCCDHPRKDALTLVRENGRYISIDLSGKNLRIMLLSLKGFGQEPDVVTQNFVVTNAIMKGTGDQLFNFIVNCLQRFLGDLGCVDANIAVGFVFSYPCQLLSIRSARLLWWTKGFDIKDCLQKDVVKLLENALDLNMSLKTRIRAVMNDTVGQLGSAAYRYGRECTIGVVIGYGCNSSYLEDTVRIKKFNAKAAGYNHEKMVVVTEWEEFGAQGELKGVLTSFDQEIDDASVHKGKQIIDKLTGALYLGELVRRVLAQMTLDGQLFNAQPCERLDETDSFPTKYISEILGEQEGNFKVCRRICDELDVPNHSSTDYQIIREVCHAVSKRSACIVAAAISALLRHLDQAKVKIGVGGALIQFHPTYHDLLKEALDTLAPDNVQWELVPADEGSAKGAALIAAVAERMNL